MKDMRIRKRLRSLATFSVRVCDEDIRKLTVQWVRDFGYLPCPHSATGIYGAMEIRRRINDDDVKVVAVGTAHPAKFPKIISGILQRSEGIGDNVRETVYRDYMNHPFLPRESEKRDFVKLQRSTNWETKWVDIIKRDIVQMNMARSKL